MTERDFWTAIVTQLELGERCALLVVSDRRGSAPGWPGALMAVTRHGPLAGTTGGGRAEARLIDDALQALTRGEDTPVRIPQQHRLDAANASGLVCGGEHVVVRTVLGKQHRDAVATMLARAADDDGQHAEAITPGNGPLGWYVDAVRGWQPPADGTSDSASTSDVVYQHAAEPRCRACLVGGGHVSLALSAVLVPLDFHVTVIESRAGIATFDGNRLAHRRVRSDYAGIAPHVRGGPHQFVAVMTHDCGHDAAALEALRGMPLAYLGLLGSRTKVRRLTAGREWPSFFHAPMGLPIRSRTPAEIAISIAAEMIAVRSDIRHGRTGGRTSRSTS